MYDLIATVFKYIFIVIIYIFIFSIIRMIYLDISSMKGYGKKDNKGNPYLKLVNRREHFNFKIQESYVIDEEISIGRSNKSDIVIKDPYLSHKHVSFFLQGDDCLVKDMDSTKGTFVNDEQIDEEAIILKDGDRIHIGQLDFIFVDTPEEDEESL